MIGDKHTTVDLIGYFLSAISCRLLLPAGWVDHPCWQAGGQSLGSNSCSW